MPDEGVLNLHKDTQAGATDEGTPAVGESEHDKAMIAKADSGIDANSENIQKSEEKLLAGKYKSEGELNKGVTEMLKMQYPGKTVEEIYKGLESGRLVPSSPATKAADDAAVDKGSQQEQIGAKVKAEGKTNVLDPVALTLERSENEGQLTQETRDKLLSEYNIPEATLDTYLAGLSALEEQFTAKVFDITGGEENYQGMLTWMNENVPEAELDAFNDQLGTQDLTKVKVAVEGMQARYKAVVGDHPTNLIRPEHIQPDNIQSGAYTSKAEWLADVANPMYNKDPAFRNNVVTKLSRSTGF